MRGAHNTNTQRDLDAATERQATAVGDTRALAADRASLEQAAAAAIARATAATQRAMALEAQVNASLLRSC